MQAKIIKQSVALITLTLSLALLPFSALAATDSAAISQGFSLQGEASRGALLSFTNTSNSNTVEPANSNNVSRLAGVIGDKQLLELSDGTSRQTQVVTSGTAYTLVSDINGEIKKGDMITASPLSGVGMKATTSTQVLGTAQANFSDAQDVRETEVKDRSGTTHRVHVGLLSTQVNVSYYQKPEDQTSVLPSFLQRFANAIAGRQVGVIRIVSALVVLIIAFASVAVLLYSSSQSSIIAIGRNPLSSGAVHRSLFVVGTVATGILLVMLIAVYLILVM